MPALTLRVLVCGLALPLADLAAARQMPVVEHTLANGLKLLLVERHDEPTVAAGWVAHVGSANERPGITGMAHLLEHMMFKGTPTVGTTDPQRDLAIIGEQEELVVQMRAEEAKVRAAYRRGEVADPNRPEAMSARWRELEAKLKALAAEQQRLLVKNEFDRIYTAAGTSGMNAFTSQDETAYFITVPANKLELWLWMESERLRQPVFREFYPELDVVREERRLSIEATPLGAFEEQFNAMFWDAHPYQWPILGWPSDLATITRRQADAFFATYYAPRNVTAILVGDFQQEEALALVEKYFGRIPSGTDKAPEVVTREVGQRAEKRMNAEAEVNPRVDILWHTVPFGHRDSYPLEVLAQVLGERSGRLYQGLVRGRGLATEAAAAQQAMKWAGCFNISAECGEGRAPAEVEQAIYAELDKLAREAVPAAELQKVKNRLAAAEYRRLTSNMSILFALVFAEGSGDWREVNTAGAKYQAVTAADLRRVATAYFARENRCVASYTRKPATAAENPHRDSQP